ncbi:MAG: cellulase family glycosylhydrolase, partial [Anaerolineae bacterium]|nr:cellulase family glycosylhydrolase [Anaerolineae bacterium]
PGPNPAPLVGRFRLVASSSPLGPCTGLKIDDQTRPALGVNVRELAYFGESQWPNTTAADREGFCDEVRTMKMRWVRFFAAHADFSEDDIVNHTRAALDVIADRGLLAVVVFADSIKNIKLYPAGDDLSHNVSELNHLNKDYFRDKRYRDHYLPLVVRLVTEFRTHPGVGMWQLMNEPAIYPAPASPDDVQKFGEFVDEASARIYQLDKTHPISIGMVNCAHIMPPGLDLTQFATDFYSKRRHIHVVSCHSYQKTDNSNSDASWDHEDNANADIQAAAQTGRAVFWTEFGSSQAADRVQSTRRFLSRHLDQQRASGALQWAFMIGPHFAPDKGVGDHDFGFSTASFNKQFNELRDLFIGFLDNLM